MKVSEVQGKISFQRSEEMPITFAEMGRRKGSPLRQWPRLFRVFSPVSKKWKGSTTFPSYHKGYKEVEEAFRWLKSILYTYFEAHMSLFRQLSCGFEEFPNHPILLDYRLFELFS